LEEWVNRVHCGDALEFLKSLPDKCVALIFTSPPYNMRTRVRNGVYTEREKSGTFSCKYEEFHDALSVEEYFIFHRDCIKEMLRVADVVFWNIAIVTGSKEAVFRLIGYFHKIIRDIIVWDKGEGQPAMHPAVINRCYELILIFESGGPANGRAFGRSFFPRGSMRDIWRIHGNSVCKENAACFPLDLPRRAILNWTRPGEIVCDPFMGTGTTAVAAMMERRNFIGCDISSKMIEIAKRRIKLQASQIKIEMA